MRARLGPQELGKTRPPAATAWETHPDPLVTPVVQNILPHQAVQQAGRNSPNEPPLAPSAKGWTTYSPRLFARILLITTP